MAMVDVSPPLHLSASASPLDYSPRKKRRVDDGRSPLQDVTRNTLLRRPGMFAVDELDEEDLYGTGDTAREKEAEASADAMRVDQFTIDAEKIPSPTQIFPTYPEHSPPSLDSLLPDLDDDMVIDAGPTPANVTMRSVCGKSIKVGLKKKSEASRYDNQYSNKAPGEASGAQTSFYGVDIHKLMDEAATEAKIKAALQLAHSIETMPQPEVDKPATRSRGGILWTEKYRARKFTDLIGDERTHRSVLHWLKSWDPICFPGSTRPKPKHAREGEDAFTFKEHRKILLLTGPPGLGKTTMAHVCARQAGYEVQEINASDDRSKEVVKGRIKDMAGTENVNVVDVKTAAGQTQRASRPICIVVDEVDGAVSGASGGEGGFIKALVDLVALDQKNSRGPSSLQTGPKRRKKGEGFRLLRPIILICNDLYHPSLRPLRQHTVAEVVYVRKPPLSMLVTRLESILKKEGVSYDSDGVRRLCEATWGVDSRANAVGDSSSSEGDIRGIVVMAEWVCRRLRGSCSQILPAVERLSRKWVEENVIRDLAHDGSSARSLGRGGVRDVVERVFREGAGYGTQSTSAQKAHVESFARPGAGVAEGKKRTAMELLRQTIESNAEFDKIMTDCLSHYPTTQFQDDVFLTKPNTAYDWLYFHDRLNSAIYSCQEWELAAYLSSPILAMHQLFATPNRQSWTGNSGFGATTKHQDLVSATQSGDVDTPHPFSLPSAPFLASEAKKQHKATITDLQGGLSVSLARTFRDHSAMVTELVPYAVRMLGPCVSPVVTSGGSTSATSRYSTIAVVRKASEKAMVSRAVSCMHATGVQFLHSRLTDTDRPEAQQPEAGAASYRMERKAEGSVYRMVPALDELGYFDTSSNKSNESRTKFAVRQVLEAEWRKEGARLQMQARLKRGSMLGDGEGGVHEDTNTRAKAKGTQVSEQLKSKPASGVKRDFFGRPVVQKDAGDGPADACQRAGGPNRHDGGAQDERVWVSFHEGFSNAVKKPITLAELLKGL